MRWGDFEAAAPELATLGLPAFRAQNLALIGTLKADGWPRISANEIYLVEGELLLGMMRDSRKAADLARDPRISVMTPQCERDPSHGDFKIYGRAIDVSDPRLRGAYGDAIDAAIGWRPSEPYPLFAVDLERVTHISFTTDRRMLRWTPAGGVEELVHPDARDGG